ncbi:hypothetical protein [Geminicoccus roseus]|uniref:hypothetical protein n=1 Tax=Geminicoccus roseus TaxID=404900 RepID=UPI00040FDA9B|nr:hypothetical protein [Geminicoccus roseus]
MAGENENRVTTAAGVEIPASAQATCTELVALLREACADLPMETEPGDFLVALDRNAEGGPSA